MLLPKSKPPPEPPEVKAPFQVPCGSRLIDHLFSCSGVVFDSISLELPQFDEVLISLVRNKKLTDLLGLVLAILVCEAQFNQNTMENQVEFINVITQELFKKKIPHEYICKGDILEVLQASSVNEAYDCLKREYRDILEAV